MKSEFQKTEMVEIGQVTIRVDSRTSLPISYLLGELSWLKWQIRGIQLLSRERYFPWLTTKMQWHRHQ